MVLSPNCAKIKFVASSQNSIQEKMLPKNCQESQDIMSPRILLRKIQKRLLGDQGIHENYQKLGVQCDSAAKQVANLDLHLGAITVL